MESQVNIKPPMLKGLDKQVEMEFDYEINSIKLDENEDLNCKMYYFDNNLKTYSKYIFNDLKEL